jgi:cyclic pyranopterin phosphate synthase
MPDEDQAWFKNSEILSFEELLRVIRISAELGVRKVRVTGGEPLTRKGIVEFCREVGEIKGIDDIGISTNGTLLARRNIDGITTAEQLVKAGVKSVNISLDSLNRQHYQLITRRDLLPEVLMGIEAAKQAGFESIKINSVLTKNQSETELVSLIDFAREHDLLLRFIELMPVSTQDVLTEQKFYSVGHAMKQIREHYGDLKALVDFKTNGPSSYYEIVGSAQKIGFIGAMTNLHFCESCNKLRLTCDGKLRPCLGSYLEFDLFSALRENCTDEDLKLLILNVVEKKPKEHDFRNQYTPNRRMIAIGG